MQWILASQSPRRLEILQQHGIVPMVQPAHIREVPLPQESPTDYAARLASEKAHTILPDWRTKKTEHLILAADTVVIHGKTLLEKPKDHNEALAMLKILSGATHEVITAFHLIHLPSEREIARQCTTLVTFYELSDQQILDYVNSGDPFDKAGGYGIQTVRDKFVKNIQGSFENVMGLPIKEILQEASHLL